MKRIATTLVLAAALLALSGCATQKNQRTSQRAATTPWGMPTGADASAGESPQEDAALSSGSDEDEAEDGDSKQAQTRVAPWHKKPAEEASPPAQESTEAAESEQAEAVVESDASEGTGENPADDADQAAALPTLYLRASITAPKSPALSDVHLTTHAFIDGITGDTSASPIGEADAFDAVIWISDFADAEISSVSVIWWDDSRERISAVCTQNEDGAWIAESSIPGGRWQHPKYHPQVEIRCARFGTLRSPLLPRFK